MRLWCLNRRNERTHRRHAEEEEETENSRQLVSEVAITLWVSYGYLFLLQCIWNYQQIKGALWSFLTISSTMEQCFYEWVPLVKIFLPLVSWCSAVRQLLAAMQETVLSHRSFSASAPKRHINIQVRKTCSSRFYYNGSKWESKVTLL